MTTTSTTTMTTAIFQPARRIGKSAAIEATRKTFILALTGYPDVGKDTVAGILSPQHGFATIAFADALRREVAEAWRIDSRMLAARPTKELPLPALAVGMCSAPAFVRWCHDAGESLKEPRSPRWALQTWATYQRRFDASYYARIVDRWIIRQVGVGWNRIVVSDLRDPVEETVLRQLGAKVVRIHRPDAKPISGATASHISEQHHRIKADADIVNDGSIEALAEVTLRCVASLGGTVQC